MKMMAKLMIAFAAVASASPVQKVLEMLSGLQEKVTADGAAADKAFTEFEAFCEDRARELKFSIKTAKGESEELSAVIAKESATMEALSAKIEELGASIQTSEAELKKATELRAEEAATFAATEKDLTETTDTIERASTIIDREMAKGASLSQLGAAKGVADALDAIVKASGVNSASAAKLTALLQTQDEDDAQEAPAAAVYESQSGGISSALDGLLEKAEDQLAEARKIETEALHAYELKKQGLEDEIKFSNKDLAASKKSLAEAAEKKSVAEGDLEVTTADLAEDTKSLEETEHDCVEKAEAYKEEKSSRGEELSALAEAKKVIADATGGAEKLTYGFAQMSFLQLAEYAGSEGQQAINIVRRLAFKHHSVILSQLASRMESAGPFDKVKGLITDMIDKLVAEGGAEAEKKAYCDTEMAKSTEAKEEHTAGIEKLTTKIDQATSKSTKLKDEVTTLSKELTELESAKAAMDKLRAEEKDVFSTSKPEMEQGVEGIKLALKILRDYYAADKSHESGEGAGGGIISLLEVCESDFSKLLAKMIADEEQAVAEYEAEIKEYEITKATKTKDVEYKTKEVTSLEKAISELTSDKAGVQTELDAVLEYLKGLEKECVAKAETYEERVSRRTAEIAGLKEALEVLSSDAALIQRRHGSHRRVPATLRGAALRVK